MCNLWDFSGARSQVEATWHNASSILLRDIRGGDVRHVADHIIGQHLAVRQLSMSHIRSKRSKLLCSIDPSPQQASLAYGRRGLVSWLALATHCSAGPFDIGPKEHSDRDMGLKLSLYHVHNCSLKKPRLPLNRLLIERETT